MRVCVREVWHWNTSYLTYNCTPNSQPFLHSVSVLLVHDEKYDNIQEGVEVSKHLSEEVRIRIVVSSIGEYEHCTVTLVVKSWIIINQTTNHDAVFGSHVHTCNRHKRLDSHVRGIHPNWETKMFMKVNNIQLILSTFINIPLSSLIVR